MLIHCKVGARSAEATRLALRAGLTDVANVEGGILAYLREIDSTQPEYTDRRSHPEEQPAMSVEDHAARVLDLVARIPAGRVLAYGDIAQRLGGMGPRTSAP